MGNSGDGVGVSRRGFLGSGVVGAATGLSVLSWGGLARLWAGSQRPSRLGFQPIAASSADAVVVPDGYLDPDVLLRWGDPIAGGPPWLPDASQDAAAQEVQAGMHHDGMEYYALEAREGEDERGLLAMNHEYLDNARLHADGVKTWSAEKVRKAQAAVGVSVVEVVRHGDQWAVDPTSQKARRIHAGTPVVFAGPAAERLNAEGTRGTLGNCSSGRTPWGTYLTCEENFQLWFGRSDASVTPTAEEKRYGITAAQSAFGYERYDERFDASKHPREAERFGWVVEIDPLDPDQVPVKRTALGRFRHENTCTTLAEDGRVVVYMGDDEPFEFVYKFVSSKPYDPSMTRTEAGALLDDGVLFVARFDAGDVGTWLPLTLEDERLRSIFSDEGDLMTHARIAATAVGATPMDRPEWVTLREMDGEPDQVFVSLTNNTARGTPGKAAPDHANPRAVNGFGHIIRWTETGGDAASSTFRWSIFLFGGDEPDDLRDAFGSPDGLRVDDRGVLWVQTDVSSTKLGKGENEAFGNNQMLAADPDTGEVRRFMVGPRGCEVTGIAPTPDGTTFFVNIQHPGEANTGSHWPDGGDAMPRSATIVLRHRDGRVIGS